MKRILGIDPGLLHTGWAIIDVAGSTRKYIASGVILPPTKLPLPERLAFIFNGVSELCETFQYYIHSLCVNIRRQIVNILCSLHKTTVLFFRLYFTQFMWIFVDNVDNFVHKSIFQWFLHTSYPYFLWISFFVYIWFRISLLVFMQFHQPLHFYAKIII